MLTLFNYVKSFATGAIAAIPDNIAMTTLQLAAISPPFIKTRLFVRVCGVVARRHDPSESFVIRTNFGIDSKLRCEIPLEKPSYLFGRPEHVISERSTLALVSVLAPKCRAFIDIGANEGIFIFVVSAGPLRPDIHWFEPDTDLYERLRKNLETNKIRANGNNAAVSSRNGNATFYKNLSDDASGSLSDIFKTAHRTEQRIVQTMALDAYLEERRIDKALVKVDIEGHGNEFWKGAAKAAGRIDYLIIEMLKPEIEAQLPSRIAADTGWHAYYLRDFELIHAPDGDFDYVAPFWNWLFCPVEPGKLKHVLVNTRFRIQGRT